MIPESDDFVESKQSPEAVIEALANAYVGASPEPAPPDYLRSKAAAAGIFTSDASTEKAVAPTTLEPLSFNHRSFADMLELMESLRNRALDRDVAFLQSIMRSGASVMITPHITQPTLLIPEAMRPALEEINRRSEFRKQISNEAVRIAPRGMVYTNLCNEVPLP